ncbi:hypothetical protein PM082_022960 [Marasmius tenuissimus]|nr:hypothetical protein PM082_022960 [Marasmius tenuissimus]
MGDLVLIKPLRALNCQRYYFPARLAFREDGSCEGRGHLLLPTSRAEMGLEIPLLIVTCFRVSIAAGVTIWVVLRA